MTRLRLSVSILLGVIVVGVSTTLLVLWQTTKNTDDNVILDDTPTQGLLPQNGNGGIVPGGNGGGGMMGGGGMLANNAIAVSQHLSSTYTSTTADLNGWFASGANADIVLSAVGFNATGGSLLFNHPRSLASNGSALVLSDGNNNRVLVWKTLPSKNTAPDLVLGQSNFDTNAPGTDSAQMNWPGQVSLAKNGTLAVADSYNNRILLWKSMPTQSGQAADIVLTGSDIQWPWGVWTDGNRLVVSATGNGKILVWNTLPTSETTPPSFTLASNDFRTPRTITSNGTQLIVGDHNAFQTKIGDFIWNTFPTSANDTYDFFAPDPIDPNFAWMKGDYTSDGKLIMLGRKLHIWNTPPQQSDVSPDISINGYNFRGGDGGDVAIGGGRVYVLEYNGNKISVYNSTPTDASQSPDFAIGSPDLTTNTLRTAGIITNPVPATDGKRLFVSSDFDRRLVIWDKLPDESGALPDWEYSLAFQPWDNELNNNAFAMAGDSTAVYWSALPTNGELPDHVWKGGIGSVKFQKLTGVAFDNQYFYLADNQAGKVYIWQGIPDENDEPIKTLTLDGVARLSSDGNMLVALQTEQKKVTFYSADTPGKIIGTLDGNNQYNLPRQAILAHGAFFLADTLNNRVLVWKDADNAAAGKAADMTIGENNPRPAIGEKTLFWPGTVAFDGSYLWVGEYKFSHRLLRFSVE